MKKLLVLLALLVPVAAYAAISGTERRTANQQVAMGQLQVGAGTATAVTNAATINAGSGILTTEALTTAAGATQAITLSNNRIAAGDMVYAMLDGNGSAGEPVILNTRVTAGQAVFLIKNVHGSGALDAAVKIMFMINKAGNTN